VDLIFPHHENEIAQSRCGSDASFAKYWLHLGFLKIDKQKMSKSLGNYFTAREVLEKFSGETIRLYYLQKHYRSPIEYNLESLRNTTNALERLTGCIRNIKYVLNRNPFQPSDKVHSIIQEYRAKIQKVMNDDFNTAAAIGYLFDLVRVANEIMIKENLLEDERNKLKNILDYFYDVDQFFGLIPGERVQEESSIEPLVDLVINLRNQLRKDKNFALADKIRSDLEKIGYIIEDGPQGSKWKRNDIQ